MLSTAKVVERTKKALQKMWKGTCTVTERQKTRLPNGSTSFAEVVIYEDIPCRLSFNSIPTTDNTDSNASSIAQVTKLFLDPEISIKAGSKISVTQEGVTTDYKYSSTPAVYASHQEIVLELFKEWA